MRDAVVADYRRIQKKLVARFLGDPKCVNESRVFRLPGFNHCKGEPVPVACVKFDPELRYAQAELEAALPNITVSEDAPTSKSAEPPRMNPRKGLPLVAMRCAFIQHCKADAATLSEHDWYGMVSNLAVFQDGDKLVHELSSGYPRYNFDETQAKINHFLGSGTKPMTCAKIAEAGFQCPHIADGTCGCKAPAALCYAPADLATLRALLETAVKVGSASDDLQTAQQFVRDDLYNADAVLAAAFIDNEIREKFGFSTAP